MKKTSFLSRLLMGERIERPFFLFLTLMLVGIYVWVLTDSPALDSVWKIVLFTVLMNLHIALYWISPMLFARPRWLGPMLIVQGLLAFSMGMLTRVIGITLGLYPGLIGLVIGMPVRRVWRILAAGFLLALSLTNYLLITGPGAALWWALGTVPVVLFVTMYVSMYLRQAEAREQAQSLLRDLEAANRQLSDYAARVEDLTIAAERQRMARELHDTLSQGLAGLVLQLEAADAHLAGNRPERARSILRQSMEKARAALADARRAIDDLRQPAERNLAEAVREEAERFMAATGIHCLPEIQLAADVPEPAAEAAARAVAEGLTNIARHANARTVTLRLTSQAGRLELEICDDGVGFDPAAVEAGHYGLLGMRERVRLAGGILEVHSQPGKGACLAISIPLETDSHA
jgi:NarL family two-component system sensor histidine kinase YdfH